MALYLRRLVSGNRARTRDDRLGLELDLVYLTDRIAVMGFPAVGVEGIYRNRRADVQRFLAARHGSDFWVFNFCPLTENAYHESVFDGRVSRYPFPDHHVPPFPYLALVTREIQAWLSGSDARVAVLHCKAGKGRSGTLACAYLLSLPSASITSSLRERLSEWSLIGDKEGLQTPLESTPSPLRSSGANISRVSSEPAVNTLENILDLHTSRRMKPSLHHSGHHPDVPLAKKPKMGVSIPSQRRWLFYWSQVLTGNGPLSLRPFQARSHLKGPFPFDKTIHKIKLTKLVIRMHEPSGIQPRLYQAANVMIASAGKGRAVNESTGLWASLARYSDRLIDELEHLEKESSVLNPSLFKDDRWDKAKMVRNFARMCISDVQLAHGENQRPLLTYVLHPLDGGEKDWVKLSLKHETSQQGASHAFVSSQVEEPLGIVLDADREVRIKLFLGEITLGWVWIIPGFHVSSGSPSSNLVLSGDDFDFAIGIGRALVDMSISFACCSDECV